MTDNEFDHLFSENLKNSRSIIEPDENDWQDLSSKIDHFQSNRRNWLKFIPWLLLPLVSGYGIFRVTSLEKMQQNLIDISREKDFDLRPKDTIFLEKEILIYDTLYKYIYVNKLKDAMQSVNNEHPLSSIEQNTSIDNFYNEDFPLKNNSWEKVDLLESGRNLSIVKSQQRAKNPERKFFSEKKENKLNIISNIGLSIGTLLPLNSIEIRKPMAIELMAEFEVIPRFSIKPSLLYTQHFFELEDLNSTKIVLSNSNNPQGSFTLHEIKGTEKKIIPAISLNYYFYRNKNVEGYSGVGIASNFTLPTQLEYEFKDLTNNNTYKYNLKEKIVSGNTSFFINIGGKMHTKSAVSFFGEVRVGISKNQASNYKPFMVALAGASYAF